MQNLCPYKDNNNLKKLPCNWHFHPQDTNIRLCDCGNWYKIDEAVNHQYGNLPLILMVLAVVLVIGHAVFYEKPSQNIPTYSSYDKLGENHK
jgi:hypothetical protein